MLTKVISGAQTGADRGGLIAAKQYGISTGGWMPLGFLALDGNHPEFAELYSIQEHKSPKYPPRTLGNVKDSNGTARFASKWNTPGEKCTLKCINQANKPYIDIEFDEKSDPQILVDWILKKNIRILNIAGNTEQQAPGIEAFVVTYLTAVFEKLDANPS
jgi:hypothetical protein